MKNNEFKRYIYTGLTAVAVIAVCIVFWYCIQYWSEVARVIHMIIGIVAPIIYGAVLAYLTTPIYNRVTKAVKLKLLKVWKDEKHVTGLAKAAGTFVSVSLVLVIVAGLFQMLIPQMIESLMGIRDSFPTYLQNLYAWIQQVLADNPDIEAMVLSNLQNSVTMAESWLEKSFTNIDMTRLGEFLTGVSSSVLSLLVFIKNWLIGLIVMVYLLNIKDTLSAQGKKIIYSCMNLKWANNVIEELRFVNQMFGGFIIGKLVDSLIIGIICFIGTSLMKMPFTLLISVIIGVTNIIPFFGPFIGAIPTGFLVLLVSPVKCIYFLIFILLLQQFDGNILGPKILGNATGLSSFWVMFAILLFGGVMGFAGMVVGVPLFAVLYSMLTEKINHLLKKRGLSVDTNDYRGHRRIDPETHAFVEAQETMPPVSAKERRRAAQQKNQENKNQ